MSLNIKSPEADRLVTALAGLTGETKTQAVVVAVRERLERMKRQRDQETLAADLMRIGKRCAGNAPQSRIDHGDLLYDALGLPR